MAGPFVSTTSSPGRAPAGVTTSFLRARPKTVMPPIVGAVKPG